jgi:hypothetical protein
MCPVSLLGKTLKGVADTTVRYDNLFVYPDGKREKSESFECGDGFSEIKFLKLVCSNDTSADYKVDYTVSLNGISNTWPCLASVDNNMNIRVINFGRIDLKIKDFPFPIPFPIPGEIKDILYNLDMTFTKQKCKYQASGKFTLSKEIIIPTVGSLEVNASSIIKSGIFKLSSN